MFIYCWLWTSRNVYSIWLWDLYSGTGFCAVSWPLQSQGLVMRGYRLLGKQDFIRGCHCASHILRFLLFCRVTESLALLTRYVPKCLSPLKRSECIWLFGWLICIFSFVLTTHNHNAFIKESPFGGLFRFWVFVFNCSMMHHNLMSVERKQSSCCWTKWDNCFNCLIPSIMEKWLKCHFLGANLPFCWNTAATLSSARCGHARSWKEFKQEKGTSSNSVKLRKGFLLLIIAHYLSCFCFVVLSTFY